MTLSFNPQQSIVDLGKYIQTTAKSAFAKAMDFQPLKEKAVQLESLMTKKTARIALGVFTALGTAAVGYYTYQYLSGSDISLPLNSMNATPNEVENSHASHLVETAQSLNTAKTSKPFSAFSSEAQMSFPGDRDVTLLFPNKENSILSPLFTNIDYLNQATPIKASLNNTPLPTPQSKTVVDLLATKVQNSTASITFVKADSPTNGSKAALKPSQTFEVLAKPSQLGTALSVGGAVFVTLFGFLGVRQFFNRLENDLNLEHKNLIDANPPVSAASVKRELSSEQTIKAKEEQETESEISDPEAHKETEAKNVRPSKTKRAQKRQEKKNASVATPTTTPKPEEHNPSQLKRTDHPSQVKAYLPLQKRSIAHLTDSPAPSTPILNLTGQLHAAAIPAATDEEHQEETGLASVQETPISKAAGKENLQSNSKLPASNVVAALAEKAKLASPAVISRAVASALATPHEDQKMTANSTGKLHNRAKPLAVPTPPKTVPPKELENGTPIDRSPFKPQSLSKLKEHSTPAATSALALNNSVSENASATWSYHEALTTREQYSDKEIQILSIKNFILRQVFKSCDKYMSESTKAKITAFKTLQTQAAFQFRVAEGFSRQPALVYFIKVSDEFAKFEVSSGKKGEEIRYQYNDITSLLFRMNLLISTELKRIELDQAKQEAKVAVKLSYDSPVTKRVVETNSHSLDERKDLLADVKVSIDEKIVETYGKLFSKMHERITGESPVVRLFKLYYSDLCIEYAILDQAFDVFDDLDLQSIEELELYLNFFKSQIEATCVAAEKLSDLKARDSFSVQMEILKRFDEQMVKSEVSSPTAQSDVTVAKEDDDDDNIPFSLTPIRPRQAEAQVQLTETK